VADAVQSREILLSSRPRGWPTSDDFTLATVDVPSPQDGQVLVRNLYMSVDPYMRGRMNDVKSYVPPFSIGQPLEGAALGEVVLSRAPAFSPGDLVTSARGWRECFVAEAKELRAVDPSIQPITLHLSALGMTGFTAWVGLKLAELKEGDRVFVSGAAGAVGSIAGQLAKLRGSFVVGSAGSPEKVRLLLEELGFDAAFDYKDGPVLAQLSARAPEGIDVYFDNVGGEHLEAALWAMRDHGRVIACGAISRYNDEKPSPGPANLFTLITKRLTMRGFIVTDWMKDRDAFVREVAPLVAGGRLRVKETIVEGIERAPQAFLGMLRGQNVGKMLVKLS